MCTVPTGSWVCEGHDDISTSPFSYNYTSEGSVSISTCDFEALAANTNTQTQPSVVVCN